MTTTTARLTTSVTVPGSAMGPALPGPLKILVVDDAEANRTLLNAILTKAGYRVVTAENGRQALEVFEREQPDLIVMDVMMPVMDGYTATKQIKIRCRGRFVPVIFLTAVTDEAKLAACVDQGGDDFLTKPVSRRILLAKVNALNRVRLMHETVQVQRDELASLNAHFCVEQSVARQIYDRVMESGALNRPDIRYRLSSAAIMSGDLILAAVKPTGALCALLGDFTGHGLAAAAGALPVAETFYAMIGKGFPIEKVAAEINLKLHHILPIGLFCAACLVELNASDRTLKVWNGGIPEGLLYRPGRGIVHRLTSRHLPLGLLDKQAFDPALDVYGADAGDRLYLYSDGVIECVDAFGVMFGQENLEACLAPTHPPEDLFPLLNRRLNEFCGQEAQRDDMTLLELTCSSTGGSISQAPASPKPEAGPAQTWRVDLELSAGSVKTLDPLPQLMRLLADFESLPQEKEPIFMVLAELVTNAIDHGLLGLDSQLKASPEGFAAYYERRTLALANLTEGRIRIQLHQAPFESGSQLIIRVEDSGPGFDHRQIASELAANLRYSGRGIPLVRSLCRQLTYHGCGNQAEAVYVWP